MALTAEERARYEELPVVRALRAAVADGGTEVAVTCACGWDAGGDLRFVDVYQAQWPPVPKGSDPSRWERVEEYGDETLPLECPRCDRELKAETLRLVVRDAVDEATGQGRR